MTLWRPPIPGFLMDFVLGHWPEGDEDAMRRTAKHWSDMAEALKELQQPADQTMVKALSAIDGRSHGALENHWQEIGGDTGDLDKLITICDSFAKQLEHGATDIEHAKLTIYISLATLVITFIPGIGTVAGAGAALAVKLVIRKAASELLEKLAAKGTAYLAERAAARLAFRVGTGAAVGSAMGGGTDLAAQGIEIAAGHRTDGLDWRSVGMAAGAGAVAGGVAAPIGAKMADGMASVVGRDVLESNSLGGIASRAMAEVPGNVVGNVAGSATTSGGHVDTNTLFEGAGGGISRHKPEVAVPHVDTSSHADTTPASSTHPAPTAAVTDTTPRVDNVSRPDSAVSAEHVDAPASVDHTAPPATAPSTAVAASTPGVVTGDGTAHSDTSTSAASVAAAPTQEPAQGAPAAVQQAPTVHYADTIGTGQPNSVAAHQDPVNATASGDRSTSSPPSQLANTAGSGSAAAGHTLAGQSSPAAATPPAADRLAPRAADSTPAHSPTPAADRPGPTTASRTSNAPVKADTTGPASDRTPGTHRPTDTARATAGSDRPDRATPATATPHETVSAPTHRPDRVTPAQTEKPAADHTADRTPAHRRPDGLDSRGHRDLGVSSHQAPGTHHAEIDGHPRTPRSDPADGRSLSRTREDGTTPRHRRPDPDLASLDRTRAVTDRPDQRPHDRVIRDEPERVRPRTSNDTNEPGPIRPEARPHPDDPNRSLAHEQLPAPHLSRNPTADSAPEGYRSTPARNTHFDAIAPHEDRSTSPTDQRASTSHPQHAPVRTPELDHPRQHHDRDALHGGDSTSLSPSHRDIQEAHQTRQAREQYRSQTPERGTATPVHNGHRTFAGPAYEFRRYPGGHDASITVASIKVHMAYDERLTPEQRRRAWENAQLATDLTFNRGKRLLSGDWFLVDLVPATDPSTAHMRLHVGDGPGFSHPDTIAAQLREQLGLPATADPSRLTSEDIRQLSNDIAKANTPAALDGLQETRLFGRDHLQPIERAEYQHAVEDALRDGNRFLVGADPRTNPYGRLINDGGPEQPGRNANCVDNALAALSSFNGRPQVAAASWTDRLPNGRIDESDAPGENIARGAAWLGGTWEHHIDGRPITAQYQALHDRMRQEGPGSAALVSTAWPARDNNGAVFYNPDGTPQMGDGHATVIVYPYDASGPVWWDPQAGTFSDHPPRSLTDHSIQLQYMIVDSERGPHGAPATPDHRTSPAVPGPDLRSHSTIPDDPVRARLGVPQESHLRPGFDRADVWHTEPGGEQTDRNSDYSHQLGPDHDRADVRRGDPDRSASAGATNLSRADEVQHPTDPGELGRDRVSRSGGEPDPALSAVRGLSADDQQEHPRVSPVGPVRDERGLVGGMEDPQGRRMAERGDLRGLDTEYDKITGHTRPSLLETQLPMVSRGKEGFEVSRDHVNAEYSEFGTPHDPEISKNYPPHPDAEGMEQRKREWKEMAREREKAQGKEIPPHYPEGMAPRGVADPDLKHAPKVDFNPPTTPHRDESRSNDRSIAHEPRAQLSAGDDLTQTLGRHEDASSHEGTRAVEDMYRIPGKTPDDKPVPAVPERDTLPPPKGMHRGSDGLLHQPGDRPDSYRTRADGKLHDISDPAGTFRDKNYRLHDRSGGFAADHLGNKDVNYKATPEARWGHAVENERLRERIASVAAERLRQQGIDHSLLAAEAERIMPEFGIGSIDDLKLSVLNKKITELRGQVLGDRALSDAEKEAKIIRLEEMKDAAEKYHQLNVDKVLTSKELGELGGEAFQLDRFPEAVTITPFQGAFDGNNTIDRGAYLFESSQNPATFLVFENKGVGSTLGSADTPTGRAEQCSPEHTARTLEIDQNISQILSETPEQMRARGLDPNGAEGQRLLQAKQELLKSFQEGTLQVDVYKVHTDINGNVTVTKYSMERDGIPLQIENIGGTARVPIPTRDLIIAHEQELTRSLAEQLETTLGPLQAHERDAVQVAVDIASSRQQHLSAVQHYVQAREALDLAREALDNGAPLSEVSTKIEMARDHLTANQRIELERGLAALQGLNLGELSPTAEHVMQLGIQARNGQAIAQLAVAEKQLLQAATKNVSESRTSNIKERNQFIQHHLNQARELERSVAQGQIPDLAPILERFDSVDRTLRYEQHRESQELNKLGLGPEHRKIVEESLAKDHARNLGDAREAYRNEIIRQVNEKVAMAREPESLQREQFIRQVQEQAKVIDRAIDQGKEMPSPEVVLEAHRNIQRAMQHERMLEARQMEALGLNANHVAMVNPVLEAQRREAYGQSVDTIAKEAVRLEHNETVGVKALQLTQSQARSLNPELYQLARTQDPVGHNIEKGTLIYQVPGQGRVEVPYNSLTRRYADVAKLVDRGVSPEMALHQFLQTVGQTDPREAVKDRPQEPPHVTRAKELERGRERDKQRGRG